MAISAWSFLRFLRGGDQLLVHLGDALQVVIAKVRAGDLGRAQEGQSQAPGGDFATAIGQRDQQALGVQLALVQPVHTAQGMGAQATHEAAGSSMREPESWLPAIITMSSLGCCSWALTMKS